jgi:hypothetical protein
MPFGSSTIPTALSRAMCSGFATLFCFTTNGIQKIWEGQKLKHFCRILRLRVRCLLQLKIKLSALLFLYRQVLRVDLPIIENIKRARQNQHLPVVLTKNMGIQAPSF